MPDNVFYWEVQTAKGLFIMTVIGRWTQEEAAERIWNTFKDGLHLSIIGLVPRKRVTGMGDNCGTVMQDEKGDGHLMAGRKFFEVAGKETLYDPEMTAFNKQLKEETLP